MAARNLPALASGNERRSVKWRKGSPMRVATLLAAAAALERGGSGGGKAIGGGGHTGGGGARWSRRLGGLEQKATRAWAAPEGEDAGCGVGETCGVSWWSGGGGRGGEEGGGNGRGSWRRRG